MATRDHPRVMAPPPLIFGFFIATGFALDAGMPLDRLDFPYARLVGIALVVWGFALSGRTVLEFLRHRTHPDPYHPDTHLITSGPFRWSRNPIYVAFTMMQVGIGFWSGKAWILLLIVPALAVIHARVVLPEERYLSAKFGDDYERYRKRVRRWL